MDIFISYSRQDRERVDHIARGLEAEGYSVWWDRDIRAGEEFDSVIDKQIKQAKAIVVVWSNTSVSSNWVKEEAEDGVEENKLVPALIDEVVIPRGFRRIQAAMLQDASENPTKSENWHELIASVRKLAGDGEGAQNSRRPADLRATADAGAGAALLTPVQGLADLPDTKSPAWKRLWPVAAGVLGLVVAALFAVQWFTRGPAAPPPPADMTPVVLGIFPSDSFGIDQSDGLKAAFRDTPSIEVRDLVAPIDAMKRRDAPELMEGLRANLAERNVIAIVGPSITEFTPEVLRVIEESGRNPAIILMTAGAREDLGWNESALPIFRVCSGVDERAEQFARLAQNTIASGVDLVLMVESVPNSNDPSYGELFFGKITDRLPRWAQWYDEGRVRSINYRRGAIMDSVSLPRLRRIFDQNKMVIVVGLSGDYKTLVENLYRAEDPPRAAMLGGWNNSHDLQQLSERIDIQFNRLFDMTDVFRSPADVRGLPDARRFEEEFGELNPSVRNVAVTFDSGLVIKQAVSQIEGEISAERLVEVLRGQRFNGITGEVSFVAEGPNRGQNSGAAGGLRPLYLLNYNPYETDWSEIESFDGMVGEKREFASR